MIPIVININNPQSNYLIFKHNHSADNTIINCPNYASAVFNENVPKREQAILFNSVEGIPLDTYYDKKNHFTKECYLFIENIQHPILYIFIK